MNDEFVDIWRVIDRKRRADGKPRIKMAAVFRIGELLTEAKAICSAPPTDDDHRLEEIAREVRALDNGFAMAIPRSNSRLEKS